MASGMYLSTASQRMKTAKGPTQAIVFWLSSAGAAEAAKVMILLEL